MKSGIRIFFAGSFCSLFVAINACSRPAVEDSLSDPVVFVASTPCSAAMRPLPGIPEEAPCELIKWKLQLFSGKAGRMPGTYILDCDYGMPKQGTKGFINGGTHLHREGKWIIAEHGGNPGKVVYQLDPDTPRTSVSFLRLNKNLVHLLDREQRLMIGTGAWSYTFNRIPQ